jgi:hypothetical protein
MFTPAARSLSMVGSSLEWSIIHICMFAKEAWRFAMQAASCPFSICTCGFVRPPGVVDLF